MLLSHIYIHSHVFISKGLIIQVSLFSLKFRGGCISRLLWGVSLGVFGDQNNTYGDHCLPTGAPPGPVLVPALAGSSGLPVWPPAAAPGLPPLAKHPPPVAPNKGSRNAFVLPLSLPFFYSCLCGLRSRGLGFFLYKVFSTDSLK